MRGFIYFGYRSPIRSDYETTLLCWNAYFCSEIRTNRICTPLLHTYTCVKKTNYISSHKCRTFEEWLYGETHNRWLFVLWFCFILQSHVKSHMQSNIINCCRWVYGAISADEFTEPYRRLRRKKKKSRKEAGKAKENTLNIP
jgi:hypothetical protein